MQTVVLAAGEGTRMRPLTDQRPKPALPVGDRPLVMHTLETAVQAGATSLVVVVGYEADVLREQIGDSYAGVPVTYTVQDEQRGTADAVKTSVDCLEDGPFAVLNGDALYDAGSLSALFDNGPSVGTYHVENPSQYGVLNVDDKANRVTGVVEKPSDPPSNLINAGAYVFPAAAREWLDVPQSERGELELTDTLERACTERSVQPVEIERWLDIGRPWELLAANEWKLEEYDRRIDGDVHEAADLRGTVVVEEGATIDAGVVIEGPAMIREGASVGPNAYIRGATLIGPGVSVGHSVEVKNSVLMADAAANHLSYVGDSVLGQDVNLGASTQIANLRHDDTAVEFTVKGDRVSTGRRKFGAVLGDSVKTGINAALNAGVRLSTGATVRPGETVLTDQS